jgi:hypothetical protein
MPMANVSAGPYRSHVNPNRICSSVDKFFAGYEIMPKTCPSYAHGEQHGQEGYAILEIVGTLSHKLPCVAGNICIRSLRNVTVSDITSDATSLLKPRRILARKPLAVRSPCSAINFERSDKRTHRVPTSTAKKSDQKVILSERCRNRGTKE